MNYVTLVGRLTCDPEVIETNNGSSKTIISVAVQRPYKNSEGIYETDFIPCVLWNGVASATKNYCHKGDMVGIKGKLQTRSYEDDKNTKKYILEVVADKVTFLSTAKENE